MCLALYSALLLLITMLALLILGALLAGQGPCQAVRPFSERLAEALVGGRVQAAAEAMAVALRVRQGARLGVGSSAVLPPPAVAPPAPDLWTC